MSIADTYLAAREELRQQVPLEYQPTFCELRVEVRRLWSEANDAVKFLASGPGATAAINFDGFVNRAWFNIVERKKLESN